MRRSLREPRTRGLAAAGLALALLPAALVLPARAAPDDARPAVIGRKVIGHSVQGRPIVAWHLGEKGKPKVVLISVMHGNEPAPRRILNDLRDGAPVHDLNLWVVPVYNPDGLAHHQRRNAHGVDPNRNYPYKWARLTGSYYSGRKPASEPETKAMMPSWRRCDRRTCSPSTSRCTAWTSPSGRSSPAASPTPSACR